MTKNTPPSAPLTSAPEKPPSLRPAARLAESALVNRIGPPISLGDEPVDLSYADEETIRESGLNITEMEQAWRQKACKTENRMRPSHASETRDDPQLETELVMEHAEEAQPGAAAQGEARGTGLRPIPLLRSRPLTD